MNMEWFKFCASDIHWQPMVDLTDSQHRLLINLMCAACRIDGDGGTGISPMPSKIAKLFRINDPDPFAISQDLDALREAGLVHVTQDGFLTVHEWERHRFYGEESE